MTHPLDGVRLKLVRANDHLDAIYEMVAALKYGHYEIRPHSEIDTAHNWLVLHLPTPDPYLALIIGDCIHNVRCALDHLIWQLVIVNHKSPSTSNMFPICKTPDGWTRHLKRGSLNGVSVQAQTLIERLQPYLSGDNTLGILSELENIDKHRALHITTILAKDVHAWFTDSEGKVWGNDTIAAWGTLRNETPLVGVPKSSTFFERMTMHSKASVFVAFQDPPAVDLPVDVTLRSMIDFVKDSIVPRFEPFFD